MVLDLGFVIKTRGFGTMIWGSKFSKIINDFIGEVWPWFDPGSRLFILNIIAASLISVAFILWVDRKNSKGSKSSFFIKSDDMLFNFNWSYLFNKKYWLHKSALVDYKIYFINGLIKVLFFAPVVGLGLYFSMCTIKILYFIYPDFQQTKGSFGLFLCVTVFAFIWDDFLRFFHHMLMHKIPSLWTIHKTHHSAEVLTPITLYRIHPLESLLAAFRNALSYGVISGLFMFLFSGSVNLVTFFGVNIFGFVFNLTTGNLRHSQIPISFGMFEYLLISPKQHQIHHSSQQKHFDKNFGVALSIWDLMFGSFLQSKDEKILGYGVEGMDATNLGQQFWPWKKTKLINFFDLKSSVCKIIPGKVLALIIFLLNPTISKANNACAIILSDQTYFVENRFITLTAMNVILNTRSDIPGRFRATLIQPKSYKGSSIPAYFSKYSLERKYIEMRHPAGPEIHGLWVSGHLEWMDDEFGKSELVLIITNLWRKDPKIQFDPAATKLIGLGAYEKAL
jgi:sterol desaturase/sphingolipid hydroxylase (fatty acid hydroxylase superfamily)